jgi:hypothetical protein
MQARQRSRLDPGFIVPTLAKEKDPTIGTVEVERGGQKYVFFLGDDGWRLRLPGAKVDVRADDARVRELIDQVRQARKSDEADITRNLAQWGLDSPSGKVTLKSKSGDREWTLYLGRTSPEKDKEGRPAPVFVYVNSSDRPRDVLAVRARQLDSALITAENINKYRSPRLLDVGLFNTAALELTQPSVKDGPALALEKTAQGTWWFKKPAYGPAEVTGPTDAKGIAGVQGLISALDAIKAESDKDFEAPGKNVFSESQALLRVEVRRSEEGKDKKGGPQVLLVGPRVGPKSDEYYARLAADEAVVRVAARNVDQVLELLKSPHNLRSRDLTQIEARQPDVVRVSRGSRLADVTTLYRPLGDEWKVVSGTLRHKASEAAVAGPDGLLTALQAKGKVQQFFDVADEAKQGAAKDKELGLDSPLAQVAVWIDGLDKDAPKKDEKKDDKKGEKKDDKKGEKKDDKGAKKDDKKEEKKDEPRIKADAKPALKLTFAKKADKTGTTVYVKRETADGVVSRVAVPASILDKVLPPEGPLAYLSTNLAAFRDDDAVRLELSLPGGRKFVATREQPKQGEKKDKKAAKKDEKKEEKPAEQPEEWRLVEPVSFKDRPYADKDQLRRVLEALVDLNATRYVEKVDAKTDLSKYGLGKAPAVVARVTLKKEGDKGEGKTIVYHFGSEARKPKDKGPAGVYGVIESGTDLQGIVFVVPEGPVNTLKEAELRDRTVFKFDPEKAKEVRLEIKVGLETRKPVFERKKAGGPWTVKSGVEGFNLDSDKVEMLVNTLSGLKAGRYVSFDKADKAHQLGKDAKLKVEVLLDDGKTTHTLSVGAQEGTTFYAESNSLPGAVFTVPLNPFSSILTDWLKHFGRAE